MKIDRKEKIKGKVSILTVFLWIFLVVTMLTIVIGNIKNTNALEEENIKNLSIVDDNGVDDYIDADVEHHVYMPAGTSADISIFKPFYYYEDYFSSYIEDGAYAIFSYELLNSGNKSIASISPLINKNASLGGNELVSTITSNTETKKDDTTTFVVKYVYGRDRITQIEKIIVHIIEPRNEFLDIGMSKQISFCKSAFGTITKGKINSSNRSIITISNFNTTGYKAKRNSDGEATVICDYKFTDKIKISDDNYNYFQTIVVDVVNFIPNESKEYVTLTYIDGDFQYKQDEYEKGYNAVVLNMTNTRENYVFKGWGLSPNAVEVAFNPNDIVILNDNMTLYAIWEEVRLEEYVTLTYIDGDFQYKQDEYEKGYNAVVSNMTNTRENYVFKGWGISPNAVEVAFNPNDICVLNDDMTLYAIWEEVRLKEYVTLTYIDGDLQYKQDEYEKGYNAVISNMTNTRENYVFKGWGISPNAVEVAFNPNDICVLNDNTTLYAIWEEVKPKDVFEDYNLPNTSDTNIVMYVIIFVVAVIIAIIVIVIMRKNRR